MSVVGDFVWVTTSNGGGGFIKCQLQEITKDGRFIVMTPDENLLTVKQVFECGVSTETPEDLTQLSILNRPSILAAIKARYLRHSIYTQCGLVLVALNPYTALPDLYDPDQLDPQLPHVYKVAEAALKDLMLTGKSQSIIISGESGAGKTSSARFIMQHLTRLLKGQAHLQQALLATNPLLEAFGNGKTPRNDNSSRFGKYIKIFVCEDGQVHGGLIETFLLEKSRVTDNSSFHIFDILKNKDKLVALEKQAYIAGISTDEWQSIVQRLKGIEDLKRLKVKEFADKVAVDCQEVADLLGFELESLQNSLLHKTIKTKHEVISTTLSTEQVLGNRDALAKNLYTSLFDHLISLLNKKLSQTLSERGCRTFIGILDIYGFENFQNDLDERNGFEQLCINYANEKLQNAFVEHYLRNEQQIYHEEGLEWNEIEYQDNTDCINCIESHLFPLLEEECRLPKGSDRTFVAKATQVVNKIIEKGKFGIDETFIIKHFAYDVEYQGHGFLEQNRDTLSTDLSALLQQENVNKKMGAAIYFKNSLASLMQTLKTTACHYIRCIKPNQAAQPLKFEADLVLSQLEACGILATIQLSKAGYPTKWLLEDVHERFWILGPHPLQDIHPALYMVGKKYLFMRDGVLSQLETMKREKFKNHICCIQSFYRTYSQREGYQAALHGVCMLQSHFRRKRVLDAIILISNFYRYFSTHTNCQIIIRGITALQSIIKVKYEDNLLTIKRNEEIQSEGAMIEEVVARNEKEFSTSIESCGVETRSSVSEADILYLLEENRRLKAQVTFLTETASSLNILGSEPQIYVQHEILSLIQEEPDAFDDLFTPARLIFHSASSDLSIFLSALKEMISQNTTYEYLCFWISNVMELCGYFQDDETKRERLVLTLELVQDLCVELFKRLQDDFFEAFSNSLLHHNSLSPKSSSNGGSFLNFFSRKHDQPVAENINSLLHSLKIVIGCMVKSKMDISLTQPLFSWFLNNIQAHTFNLFMRQPSSFWTVHHVLQLQLNLSHFQDYVGTAIIPLFQPTPSTTEFALVKQLIKLVLFASSTEEHFKQSGGLEYGVVCPDLSRAQVRFALAKITEPALWVERALEEDLVDYGCGEEAILINLKTPQHFSLKLNLTPKTPPLQIIHHYHP